MKGLLNVLMFELGNKLRSEYSTIDFAFLSNNNLFTKNALCFYLHIIKYFHLFSIDNQYN